MDDVHELIHAEIALARAEVRSEVARLRSGALAVAAAAVSALTAAVLLLTAIAWAIPAIFAWPVWTGFAIVGTLVALIAVVTGLVGRTQLMSERHMPRTVDTMKETLRWMRARTS
jgi:hypothetical protein